MEKSGGHLKNPMKILQDGCVVNVQSNNPEEDLRLAQTNTSVLWIPSRGMLMPLDDTMGAYYPQIVEFELLFWGEPSTWAYKDARIEMIEFRVLGRPYGTKRWRPHLILHKKPIPPQNKKEILMLMKVLQVAITEEVGLLCMPITYDLLDEEVDREY